MRACNSFILNRMVFLEYQPRIINYKGMLILLFSFFFVFSGILRINAAPSSISDTSLRDTACIFAEKILFPKASAVVSCDFDDNQIHIDSIRSFFSNPDVRNLLSVKITASYSPEGNYDFNVKLAKARALALADIVKKLNPSVDSVIFILHPTTTLGKILTFSQQRFAELQVVYQSYPDNTIPDNTITDDTVIVDTVSLPANELSVEGDSIAVSEYLHTDTIAEPSFDSRDYFVSQPKDDIPLPRTGHTFGNRLFLTTNLLYDAALTPNIGVGISIADRITVLADWIYARWNNRDKRCYWRIHGGDIEVRYHIGNIRESSPLGGHHIGVYGLIACYDFQTGRTHTGVLSDKYNYAAGLSYTYSLPVGTRFNIDFSFGMGYLWGTYKKHKLIDDCDVWLSTHKQGWIGPTRAGVSLVWLIGNFVTNNRKGGGR